MKLTQEMRDILTDPAAHYFLQEIIVKGVKADPVDVVNDLEIALKLFKRQVENESRIS